MPLLLPPALERSLDLLRCPACRTRPLRRDRAALRRPTGHTYGIARCGCASLLTGRRATSGGDTAMARARDRFLATGSYAPVRARRWRLAAAALPDRGAVGPVEAAGPTTRVTVERRDLAERSMPLSPGTTPRQQEGGRARTHDGMVRARDPMSSDSTNTAGRHPGSSTVFPIVPLASIARCAAAAALSGKR